MSIKDIKDLISRFGTGIQNTVGTAYQKAQAEQNATDPMKMQRPEWQDTGSNADMQNVYNQIMNRKDFQFDLNGNALYQQLRNSYQKQGQLGTMNAIGNASAMTGGYGNSYAAAAGQQAYQQSLEELNSKIPDLYSMALQQYQMQGDQLAQKYAVAADDRAFQYGVYRDKVGDWENDRSFYYQKQRDDVSDQQWQQSFNENRRQFESEMGFKQQRAAAEDLQWQKQFDYNQFLDNRNYQYQIGRDEVSDRQWQQTFDYNKSRDEVADKQWEKSFNYNQYLDERNYNYQVNRDTVADQQWKSEFDESARRYNQDYAYQQERDKVADQQWNREFRLNKHNTLFNEDMAKKSFSFSVAQDAQDRSEAAAQQQADNNYRERYFAWQQSSDEKDLAYKYAALGLKYG